ncbi:hypothetical protein HDU86_004589 [Geranomyces michiganensis]|nr:hypothetical protein HDU86_004589 [Geranomyces michiganensis]
MLPPAIWEVMPKHNRLEKIRVLFDKHESTVAIIDLRTTSQDLIKLPEEIVLTYAQELDQRFPEILPTEIRTLVESMFGDLKERDVAEWENILEQKKVETTEAMSHAVLEVISKTIGVLAFVRDDNPLRSRDTLEMEHLQTYIHPVFREACFHFANGALWRSGEVGNDFFVSRQKADGVAVINNRDKLPLGYFEGSRVVAKKVKQHEDAQKILENLASILGRTAQTLAESRRRIPANLYTFGGQCYNLQLRLYIMEYDGALFLHDYEQANIPAQPTDAMLFVNFYLAIISWTIMIGQTVKKIDDAQISQPRPSRISSIMTSWKANNRQEQSATTEEEVA